MTTDHSKELPEGWSTATLTEAFVLNPAKPRAGDYADDVPVTFVPMPAVDAISGAIKKPSIRAFAEVRKGFTSFRDEDVILAKITPCMENGKAAVAEGLLNGLGFGSTEFHVFRPTGIVLPRYLFHFIRQESFRKVAEGEMTGSVGQKRVPAEFLRSVALPIPPVAEQRRIVAAVERLLETVASARERLERVPTTIKRFRQAVLAAACSGRLTADWRREHSIEKHSSEAVECTRSFEQGDWPDELPSSWRVGSVASVSSIVADCPHSTPKWTLEGEVCLRTTNFQAGWLDLSEVRFVSEDTYSERVRRVEPSSGDIVYSREGGILGIACQIPEGLRACLGQRMMIMRAKGWINATFLMHVLNSSPTNLVVREMTGGTASPHLNVGDVKAFRVPVPPLREQQEVVRRVTAFLSLAESIEQRATSARWRVESLTQAVLARAFRGELVQTEADLARKERRTYEPASELIARFNASLNGEARRLQSKKTSKRFSPSDESLLEFSEG